MPNTPEGPSAATRVVRSEAAPIAPDEARVPGPAAAQARRVHYETGGPVLIEGPIEVVREDGTLVRSDRPVVALCACRRSRIFPFCDTSHRRRGARQDSERDPD